MSLVDGKWQGDRELHATSSRAESGIEGLFRAPKARTRPFFPSPARSGPLAFSSPPDRLRYGPAPRVAGSQVTMPGTMHISTIASSAMTTNGQAAR
jgi:hypothetical protein